MANRPGIKIPGFLEEMLLEILYQEPQVFSSRVAEVFRLAGRPFSLSAVDYALARLVAKRWVRVKLSHIRAIRGGRRRKIYALTARGEEVRSACFKLRDRIDSILAA